MAIKEKITFENKNTIIHFRGTGQSDYGLCGADLAGDTIHENGKYDNAEQTTEKVNCEDCIGIVNYCKGIKRAEYK